MDLALNNLQRLTCHKTKQTKQTKPRQFLSLPRVRTLLPVTFGYSLSSQAVVMRQLRR